MLGLGVEMSLAAAANDFGGELVLGLLSRGYLEVWPAVARCFGPGLAWARGGKPSQALTLRLALRRLAGWFKWLRFQAVGGEAAWGAFGFACWVP